MKIKKSAVLFFLVFTVILGYGQNNLNQYKYIIVPKKYDFLKEENMYRLNTLTKMLFTENGFNAVYADELPTDLESDFCSALTVNVENSSNMFTTKLVLTLSDCRNNIVYKTDEGRSKIKEFSPAFQEALREAFKSFDGLDYKYEGPARSPSPTVAQLPVQNTEPVTVAAEKTQAKVEEVKLIPITESAEVIETEPVGAPVPVSADENIKMLFAQPTATGYQLVDMSPKVVYILQKTGLKNVFVIKDKDGLVYQHNGQWIAEYYTGETLQQEVLNIKF